MLQNMRIVMNKLNHFNVSIVKSIMRISGYSLILLDITTAVIMLILSEVLGIIEEIVEEK